MTTYDEIDSISASDKNDIIAVWYDFLSGSLSAESVCQHFHCLTGHRESLDSVEWWVSEWRGW
jgi:hypothetical protein